MSIAFRPADPEGGGQSSGATAGNFTLVLFLEKIQMPHSVKIFLAKFGQLGYTSFSHGGSSSVGRAPGCGPGGRGFKPLLSPQKFTLRFRGVFLCPCRMPGRMSSSFKSMFRVKRFAFHSVRPVVSRKKRGFSVLLGLGDAVPPPRIPPFSKAKCSSDPASSAVACGQYIRRSF